MEGGAWWAAIHGVTKSRTRLSDFFHVSLSCIGEENGNPLQYSCLENPGDAGAWWAAVYGVAQSRTRLKRLSSSSSRAFLDYELWALPGLLLPASPALWSASGQIPQALKAGSSGLCAWARGAWERVFPSTDRPDLWQHPDCRLGCPGEAGGAWPGL